MACQLENEEVVLKLYESYRAKLNPNPETNTAAEAKLELDGVIALPRGGSVIKTEIGLIQLGMPPETVKDSIALNLEIPGYYIVPTSRFDRSLGISCVAFEFPALFSFFVLKRKITLICSKSAETAIREVFQQTFLGPREAKHLKDEFYPTFNQAGIPNFQKEL